MKKGIIGVLMLLSTALFGQQKGLQFQAVILDPEVIEIPGQTIKGQALANGTVFLKFTLYTSKGLDYEEIHETKTDAFGLVNVLIGQGKSAGSFDAVSWDGPLKRLKVGLRLANQSEFVEMSDQAMSFSPYALYAAGVDYAKVKDAPTRLGAFSNDVGYLIPKDVEPIRQQVVEQGKLIVQNQADNQIALDALHQETKQLGEKVGEQGLALGHANERIGSVSSTVSAQEQRITDQANQQNWVIGQVSGLQSQLNTTQQSISGLSGAYESLANKSNALDLGNLQASAQLFPTQLAVKTYVDQSLSTAMSTGAPDATTLATGKVKLAGDLGGVAISPEIQRLQGISLQAHTPAMGQVLRFNGTAWVPETMLQSESQTLNISGSVLSISATNSSVNLPEASSSQKGIMQLAGDLAGAGSSAASPLISDLAITQAKLANGAVTDAKFSGILSLAKGGTGSGVQNFVDLTTGQSVGGAKNFLHDVTVGANKISLVASSGNAVITGSLTAGGISYPASLGNSGEVLTSNGSGGATWSSIPAQAFSGTLAVGNGGTGAMSLTGLVKGNGTAAMTAAVLNTDYSFVRLVSDEYTVSTAGQTTFTLTQTPNVNSVMRLFINGVRISKYAMSLSGRTLTYIPANNGSASLVVNDRVQLDYYY